LTIKQFQEDWNEILSGQRQGPGYGYDAIKQKIVPMAKAGIVDAAGVSCRALQTAVSGAVMALTSDTIVLKRNPQTSMEP
jgi:chaperonin GroEL